MYPRIQDSTTDLIGTQANQVGYENANIVEGQILNNIVDGFARVINGSIYTIGWYKAGFPHGYSKRVFPKGHA